MQDHVALDRALVRAAQRSCARSRSPPVLAGDRPGDRHVALGAHRPQGPGTPAAVRRSHQRLAVDLENSTPDASTAARHRASSSRDLRRGEHAASSGGCRCGCRARGPPPRARGAAPARARPTCRSRRRSRARRGVRGSPSAAACSGVRAVVVGERDRLARRRVAADRRPVELRGRATGRGSTANPRRRRRRAVPAPTRSSAPPPRCSRASRRKLAPSRRRAAAAARASIVCSVTSLPSCLYPRAAPSNSLEPAEEVVERLRASPPSAQTP